MANEIYSYPQLVEILPLEKIPNSLQGIEDLVVKITEKLFYKSFYSSISQSGHSGFYSLTIISPEELSINIGGTNGLTFILNPNNTGPGSAIPLGLRYNWDIVKYISDFKVINFSGSPQAYFDVILNLLGLTKYELIRELSNTFIDADNPAQKFVDDLILAYPGSSIILNSGNHSNPYQDIAIQAFNEGINLIEHIYNKYLSGYSLDEFVEKMKSLFSRFVGNIDLNEILNKALVPRFSASINSISAGIRFPDDIFIPVDSNIEDSLLLFDVGRIEYKSDEGFDFIGIGNISFPESKIFNTGFTLGFTNAKIDFSKKTNIPEATADGRPTDFMGVYIQDGTIGFPTFWNHNDSSSTGVIKARNLLVGTGGLSGTLGLEAKVAGLPAPLIKARFGEKFEISLDAFSLTFQQNSIIESNISGTMKIPGFKDAANNDAQIDIQVFIGQDGEFSVTAKEDQGINAIKIPNILTVRINSLEVGREDGRFYAEVSGHIDFENQENNSNGGFIKDNLPKDIEIKSLIIWDDGKIEIKGGEIVLRKPIEFELGPAKFSISALDYGSYEGEHNGVLRKYNYFGFNGGLKVDPGGVEARGDGIKFYFTVDSGQLHVFIRIEGIKVNLVIPGTATPEKAVLLLNGYLSLRQPSDGAPQGAGQEFSGKVDFTIQKNKLNFKGSAALRYNKDLPSFLVDLSVDLKTPKAIGSTGLGIYGFRALAGLRYVATKSAAGVAEEEPWWKYYKAKVSPDYMEGIQPSKFETTKGFSLGAGAKIATYPDKGFALGAKVMVLISLPEVLLIQGQAQILKNLVKIDTQDPPFFAMLSISSQSVEFALGADYKVPDDGNFIGKIATVNGVIEAGYFFSNPSAWYVNLGRDLPESSRIQVYPLFNLFRAYFYMMLSSSGIKTGAGASFEFKKEWGPLSAELTAYLDIAAKISFKPKQVGGSIALGGSVGLYIFKFGFKITVNAYLAAEAPKPFIISGSLEVCVQVLGKDRCAEFSFTWMYENALDTSEIQLMDYTDPRNSAQAVNIQSGDTFALNTFVLDSLASTPPLPDSWIDSFDNHIVPCDSYIDISFNKSVKPNGNLGGTNQGALYTEFVAPKRGKSDRVRHEYKLETVKIYSWDPTPGAEQWREYHVHDAMSSLALAPFIDPAALADLKDGYWQMFEANRYSKLRLLSQTPLSLLTDTLSANTPAENFGITDETIFCEDEPFERICINYEDISVKLLPIEKPTGVMEYYEGLLIRIGGTNAFVVNNPSGTFANALLLKSNSYADVLFDEGMPSLGIKLSGVNNMLSVEFYKRAQTGLDISNMPQFEYVLVSTQMYTGNGAIQTMMYEDLANPIDKIIVRTADCGASDDRLICDAKITLEAELLVPFFNDLIANKDLTSSGFTMWPGKYTEYSDTFFNTALFTYALSRSLTVSFRQMIYDADAGILQFNIMGNLIPYDCNFRMETLDGLFIDFNLIVSFSNLRPDPNIMLEGMNYSFLMDALMLDGSIRVIKGKTCYNIINCHKGCSGYLYEICYMGYEEFVFNSTLPSTSDVTDGVNSLVNGLNGSLSPIWRPDTKYAVVVQTVDALYQETSSSSLATYSHTVFLGFQTEGPVGHFHKYQNAGNTVQNHASFNIVEQEEREDEYRLANLKYYIDYATSYPNANGNLLNAKPLFYGGAKLNLYYNYQFIYTMFSNWATYNGTNPLTASLDVTIKDPAEPAQDPLNPGQPFLAPSFSPTWKGNHQEPDTTEAAVISNLATNGDPCNPVGSIQPIQVSSEYQLENLKPLKQYTAVFTSKYQNGSNQPIEREVHKYGFLTSRYENFAQQIGSWKVKDKKETMQRGALFMVDLNLSTQQLQDAMTLISNPNALSDGLKQKYQLSIDILLQGIFQMKALPAAVSTEFNVIRTASSNQILGVLIRNPEPFNDPKSPQSIIDSMIELSAGSSTAYKYVCSKDLSQVFITNADNSMNMPSGQYFFTFRYKLYDGLNYVDVETATVDITDITAVPAVEIL
jgi:hypothetical protein